MEVKSLILDQLSIFNKVFPYAFIVYQYKPESKTHIIELSPAINADERLYEEHKNHLEDNIENYYPGDTVVFVTPTSLTEINQERPHLKITDLPRKYLSVEIQPHIIKYLNHLIKVDIRKNYYLTCVFNSITQTVTIYHPEEYKNLFEVDLYLLYTASETERKNRYKTHPIHLQYSTEIYKINQSIGVHESYIIIHNK